MPEILPLVICMRNALLREGFVQLLRSEHHVIRGAISSIDHLSTIRIGRKKRFIVLLWLQDLDDFEPDVVVRIRLTHPKVVIVVLLDRYQPENAWKLIQIGASGVLLQSTSHELLVESLRLVTMGDHVSNVSVGDGPAIERRGPFELHRRPPLLDSPERFRADADGVDRGRFESPPAQARPDHWDKFSERERRILSCLIAGHSTDVIARTHKMTEADVDVLLGHVLRKIRAGNRAQAAAWVVSDGEAGGAYAAEPADGESIRHH